MSESKYDNFLSFGDILYDIIVHKIISETWSHNVQNKYYYFPDVYKYLGTAIALVKELYWLSKGIYLDKGKYYKWICSD